MSQAALKISPAQARYDTRPFTAPTLSVITNPSPKVRIKRDVIILGIILSALQVMDGVLTTLGINSFGTEAEGNMLLRSLMEIIGHIPALVVAKTLAIIVVAILCVLSTKISWVGRAFKVVIGIYLCAAIIPWTMILLS